LRARCRLVAVEIGHGIPRADYCEVDLKLRDGYYGARIDIKLGARLLAKLAGHCFYAPVEHIDETDWTDCRPRM
jgi:hypothetical protein